MTVRAIYENGVFRPVEPVNLPEKAEVDVVLPPEPEKQAEFAGREQTRKAIIEIMSHRYQTGQTNTAARHNEHQP
jgi:predicted DNA-binding antitoxin AbrB/MazE fold protein